MAAAITAVVCGVMAVEIITGIGDVIIAIVAAIIGIAATITAIVVVTIANVMTMTKIPCVKRFAKLLVKQCATT